MARNLRMLFMLPSASPQQVLQRSLSKSVEKPVVEAAKASVMNVIKLSEGQSMLDKIKQKIEKIFKKSKNFDMTPDPIESEFKKHQNELNKDAKK